VDEVGSDADQVALGEVMGEKEKELGSERKDEGGKREGPKK